MDTQRIRPDVRLQIQNHIARLSPNDDSRISDVNAFYFGDVREVRQAYEIWAAKLPHVHPHYAVKCNPNQEVIKFLNKLGVGFDWNFTLDRTYFFVLPSMIPAQKFH